jgi:hypothetical protein
LRVIVTDRRGRYIRGLGPADFRVLEDGIARRISGFMDGSKILLSDPESGKQGIDLTESSVGDDPDSAYTITYHPDPGRRREGFRKIVVEIVTDIAKNYRVRTRPGYQPPTER